MKAKQGQGRPTPSEITVYFDVDETLVSFHCSAESLPYRIETEGFYLYPIHSHINDLIRNKQRGHTVVVWSAGGRNWAERVVDVLGIEPYVDVILSKPSWYYDDQDASKFMHTRVYHDSK